MSSVASAAPTLPGITSAPQRIPGRQTLPRALRAEWIKLRTLRSTWITTVLAIGLTALFGVSVAVGYASSEDQKLVAPHSITEGAPFGQIAVGVLAALVITAEYSSGQIRSSLGAVPVRGRLFSAKALIVGGWGFAVGTLSAFITWAVSYPLIGDLAIPLTDPRYLGYIWGTGLAFGGIALMALGLGLLTRSTAGAITTASCLLFVIDIPLKLLSGQRWAQNLEGILPSTTQLAVRDPHEIVPRWGVPGTMAFLEHWQAIVVFSAWCFVPLAVGWVVFSRRDA